MFHPREHVTLYYQALGGCCMLLFGYASLKAIPSVFSPEPIVIITHEGIFPGKKRPLIRWQDISEMLCQSLGTSARVKMITIFLKNPEPYFDQIGPGAMQKAAKMQNAMKVNKKGAPVFLLTGMAGVEPQELMEWLDYYRSKHVR